jgi:hypothetical protein
MSVNNSCSHNQTTLRRIGPNVSGSCKTCGMALIRNPRVVLWKRGILEPTLANHCECPGETPVEIYRTGPLLKVKCVRCEGTWAIGKTVVIETSSVMSPALGSMATPRKSHKLLARAKDRPVKKGGRKHVIPLPAAR